MSRNGQLQPVGRSPAKLVDSAAHGSRRRSATIAAAALSGSIAMTSGRNACAEASIAAISGAVVASARWYQSSSQRGCRMRAASFCGVASAPSATSPNHSAATPARASCAAKLLRQ